MREHAIPFSNAGAADLERERRLTEIRRQAEAHDQTGARGIRPQGAPFPMASPETGYYGIPLLKPPQWTHSIPLYLFVGGAAGASAVVSAMAHYVGARPKLVSDARWIAAAGGSARPALRRGRRPATGAASARERRAGRTRGPAGSCPRGAPATPASGREPGPAVPGSGRIARRANRQPHLLHPPRWQHSAVWSRRAAEETSGKKGVIPPPEGLQRAAWSRRRRAARISASATLSASRA